MKSKLLLSGGCGKIGSHFAKFAMEKYFIHIADKIPWDINDHGALSGESMVIDLQDIEACRKACKDIDIVIHLAADANPEADFDASLLGSNIIATHNIFRAAKDADCKRFIFASSAHVVSAYDSGIQINSDMKVKPGNVYGVTKCFGEALAAYYAHVEGLSSIVLRIGAYTLPEEYGHFPREEMDAFLDPDDFNELLIKCIEVPELDFAIAHAISDNQNKRFDLSETREIFGYQPKADSFDIFNVQ